MVGTIRNFIKKRAKVYCAATAMRTWLVRLRIAAMRISGRPLTSVLDLPEHLKRHIEPERFPYEVAACLKFKNEARFLDEWIRFHQLVGFEHFYLYNNNSNDDYEAVLQPHIESGLVTLHQWPAVPAFPSANVHCAQTYRDQARWIAFLDADEFLLGTSEDDLRDILQDYRDYPGVVVNWLSFGSNGHERRPGGLVIENYTRREKKVDEHIKSIVNPRTVVKAVTTHFWLYTGFERAVNEKKQRVSGGFSRPPSVDRLRINHYCDKSKEDFHSKIGMIPVDETGRKPLYSGRKTGVWEESCRNHNEIEDLTIGRFLKALKSRTRNESE